MNTLTIVILVVCATVAYASAVPTGSLASEAEVLPAAAAPAELLEGAEDRWRGGYGYNGGNYYRGGYNRGGGGYYRGGGGRYRG